MSYQSKIRAEQKLQTRQALLDSAIAMFFEQGLDAPSLNAICKRAGCSRGAFYFHFESREELTIAALDQELGGFINEMTTVPSDVSGIIDGFLEAIVSNRPQAGGTTQLRFRHALAACARYPALRQRYVALLVAATAVIEARIRAEGVEDAGPRALGIRLMALGLLATIDLGQEVDLESLRIITRELASPTR